MVAMMLVVATAFLVATTGTQAQPTPKKDPKTAFVEGASEIVGSVEPDAAKKLVSAALALKAAITSAKAEAGMVHPQPAAKKELLN